MIDQPEVEDLLLAEVARGSKWLDKTDWRVAILEAVIMKVEAGEVEEENVVVISSGVAEVVEVDKEM